MNQKRKQNENNAALLRTAELAYRLAHGVRITCSDQNREPFSYPLVYTWGKHTVTHDKFALNSNQEDFASAALLHCATYIMAVQIDKALLVAVGANRFKHANSLVCAASCIARTIRNAFAHDPFNPVWLINQAECKNRLLEIKDIIRLDTRNLDGEKMKKEDYGGPIALLRLSQFVREQILNEKIT